MIFTVVIRYEYISGPNSRTALAINQCLQQRPLPGWKQQRGEAARGRLGTEAVLCRMLGLETCSRTSLKC